MGLSFATIGLYPYVWLWEHLGAFGRIGGDAKGDRSIRRFAAVGFFTQSLLVASVFLLIVASMLGSDVTFRMSSALGRAYAVLYLAVVLPLRCSCYFAIRWRIRREVALWDSSGIMADRTLFSWFRLFILGSFYVQYHINRLLGLGMPDIGDTDKAAFDFALTRWVVDYVKKRESEEETP